ncbi:MAG: hypothetical protein WED85_14065, partial [Dehalococcoidia bacterium]
LLRIGCDLYDPRAYDDPWRYFLRTIFEQAPFQDDVRAMIPRALLMYRDANGLAASSEHDIERDFGAAFGMTITNYLTLGFALYAQLLADPVFFPRVGWHSKVPAFKDLLTMENRNALLNLVSANATKFREVNQELAQSQSKTDRFDFNTLFMYPVVDLGSGKCTCPIMDLLAMRLYDAPYYELANLHQTNGRANAFRTYFGRVFHEYVGLLLKDAYSDASIVPELGPNQPGPVDWSVHQGKCSILIECRASELGLPARYSGENAEILEDLKRIVIAPVNRLRVKQRAIEQAGLLPTEVEHTHLMMVVKEPLLPVPYMREMIDAQLSEPTPYHLLAVDDLEQLLALEGTQGVCKVLAEKETDGMADDFRSFFHARRQAYEFRRNPLLDRTFDEYFAELGVPRPALG